MYIYVLDRTSQSTLADLVDSEVKDPESSECRSRYLYIFLGCLPSTFLISFLNLLMLQCTSLNYSRLLYHIRFFLPHLRVEILVCRQH